MFQLSSFYCKVFMFEVKFPEGLEPSGMCEERAGLVMLDISYCVRA